MSAPGRSPGSGCRGSCVLSSRWEGICVSPVSTGRWRGGLIRNSLGRSRWFTHLMLCSMMTKIFFVWIISFLCTSVWFSTFYLFEIAKLSENSQTNTFNEKHAGSEERERCFDHHLVAAAGTFHHHPSIGRCLCKTFKHRRRLATTTIDPHRTDDPLLLLLHPILRHLLRSSTDQSPSPMFLLQLDTTVNTDR